MTPLAGQKIVLILFSAVTKTYNQSDNLSIKLYNKLPHAASGTSLCKYRKAFEEMLILNPIYLLEEYFKLDFFSVNL
jgi:hypothetical protein